MDNLLKAIEFEIITQLNELIDNGEHELLSIKNHYPTKRERTFILSFLEDEHIGSGVTYELCNGYDNDYERYVYIGKENKNGYRYTVEISKIKSNKFSFSPICILHDIVHKIYQSIDEVNKRKCINKTALTLAVKKANKAYKESLVKLNIDKLIENMVIQQEISNKQLYNLTKDFSKLVLDEVKLRTEENNKRVVDKANDSYQLEIIRKEIADAERNKENMLYEQRKKAEQDAIIKRWGSLEAWEKEKERREDLERAQRMNVEHEHWLEREYERITGRGMYDM